MLYRKANSNLTERIIMATATVPALTDPPTTNVVTLHLVDASGDLWTEDIQVAPTAAIGDIEGLMQTYQLASNASIYKVTRASEWISSPDPDNATAAYRAAVENGINLLFRNDENFTKSFRLVAPIPAVMQGNQDIPLITATPMVNMITDYLTLASGFDLETAQYTVHRERKNNPRVRV